MSCPSPAISNRLLDAVWHERSHFAHEQRVNKQRHIINSKPPLAYTININKSKREQTIDEQCDKIDYENRLLLAKMNHINNNHHYYISNPHVATPSYKHSLNSHTRKLKHDQIIQENQSLLKRIQERKPHYNRHEWERHAKLHHKYGETLRNKPVSPSHTNSLFESLAPSPTTSASAALIRPHHAYMVQSTYSIPSVNTQGVSLEQQQFQQLMNAHYMEYERLQDKIKQQNNQPVHILPPVSSARRSNSPRKPAAHQPPQPHSARAASNRDDNSASQHSTFSGLLESQARRLGFISLYNEGRTLNSRYCILNICECPGKRSYNDTRLFHNNVIDSTTTGPINVQLHSLIIRLYDPLEAQDLHIQIGFSTLKLLHECKHDPSLLKVKARKQLAMCLLQRLEYFNSILSLSLHDTPRFHSASIHMSHLTPPPPPKHSSTSSSPTASSSHVSHSPVYRAQHIQELDQSQLNQHEIHSLNYYSAAFNPNAKQQEFQLNENDNSQVKQSDDHNATAHQVAYTDAFGVNYYYDPKKGLTPLPTSSTSPRAAASTTTTTTTTTTTNTSSYDRDYSHKSTGAGHDKTNPNNVQFQTQLQTQTESTAL